MTEYNPDAPTPTTRSVIRECLLLPAELRRLSWHFPAGLEMVIFAMRRCLRTALTLQPLRRGCSTASSAVASDPPPSLHQLFLHARLAAVPMVGFGFMDNIIMIQAGDYIDAHLGVTLGFSSLVAAALGNVVSDSSGVLFGGVVERVSDRLRLTQPKLTAAQAKMPQTRRAATLGQLVGVICGCFLGMTNLLFMDLQATERLKRAKQLETVFEPVMNGLQTTIAAERCTLYLYDEDTRELWTKVATVAEPQKGRTLRGREITVGEGWAWHEPAPGLKIIKLDLDGTSLASCASRTKSLINIPDAYQDQRHDSSWDRKTGYTTRAVLCYPIVDDEGKLYGCIQAVNKVGGGAFNANDEKLMRMLSSHISIFVEAMG